MTRGPGSRRMDSWHVAALLAATLVGGCQLEQIDDEDAGRRGDVTDAGRGHEFIRGDGGTLRQPDAGTGTDAGTGGGGGNDGGGGNGGLDAGGGNGGVDAGGGNGGVDAGNNNGAFDAGAVQGNCVQWQQCAPHFDDLNSAYECVNYQCVCDPNGQWQPACTNMGGYFSAFDCYCVQDGNAPPGEDPDPDDDCGYEYEYYCEPDRWVDDSHYEERCETINGETECRDVWVEDGYYEEGGCNHVRWVWKCR